jgi:hypothetical protein
MKDPEKPKEGTPAEPGTGKKYKLKTDYPLSEKDEVKEAEEKMRKREKKN